MKRQNKIMLFTVDTHEWIATIEGYSKLSKNDKLAVEEIEDLTGGEDE